MCTCVWGRERRRRGCQRERTPRAHYTGSHARFARRTFSSCASYMGTICAPRPWQAYMVTAHSSRLLEIIATLSPRLRGHGRREEWG